MRHTTVHLAEHPQGGTLYGTGQAHSGLAEYQADRDQREEMALHALEAAVLPVLVMLARDWTTRIDYLAATVAVSVSDVVADNAEVPGVPDQVTLTATAALVGWDGL
jgi:hypothetical protein